MQRYGILVSVAGVVAAAGLEGVFGQWPVAGQNFAQHAQRSSRKANQPSQFSFSGGEVDLHHRGGCFGHADRSPLRCLCSGIGLGNV